MLEKFLREKPTQLFFRSLAAAVLLGCARYAVWYVNNLHMAYAASQGKIESDMWSESYAQCGSATNYDFVLELSGPLNRFYASHPDARDNLVQTFASLELILLLSNTWLFVTDDTWILYQNIAAFGVILVAKCASWHTIPCGALQLPLGAAWLSDFLAGGSSQLPITGLSGSTVLVCLALYNMYRCRQGLFTAALMLVLLLAYLFYHAVLRWYTATDELGAIAIAWTIASIVRALRILHNATGPLNKLSISLLRLSASQLSGRPQTPCAPSDLGQVALAYEVAENTLDKEQHRGNDSPMLRSSYEADRNRDAMVELQRPPLHQV